MQVGDYAVKPSCIDEENRLRNFLKENNFRYEKFFENNPSDREYVIVINVINRIYFEIDKFFIPSSLHISANEFLDEIYYSGDENIIRKKLFSDEGDLIYEGYTVNDKPYGLGTVYYANGNKCQEGIFDFKGLNEGKEFYHNGQVKFEGIFRVNSAYGPNFPIYGNLYNENGDLMFSGKFQYQRGGVGFPMMKYPRYGQLKNRPDIKYIRKEELEEFNMKTKAKKIEYVWDLLY